MFVSCCMPSTSAASSGVARLPNAIPGPITVNSADSMLKLIKQYVLHPQLCKNAINQQNKAFSKKYIPAMQTLYTEIRNQWITVAAAPDFNDSAYPQYIMDVTAHCEAAVKTLYKSVLTVEALAVKAAKGNKQKAIVTWDNMTISQFVDTRAPATKLQPAVIVSNSISQFSVVLHRRLRLVPSKVNIWC